MIVSTDLQPQLQKTRMFRKSGQKLQASNKVANIASNYSTILVLTRTNVPVGHVSKSCCVRLVLELFSAGKAK